MEQKLFKKNDSGFIWAKNMIEKAFSSIATGSCVNYSQKGAFSVYQNQILTSENRVYMDLFEILIFGDNTKKYNRANDLSDDVQNRIRISLLTLNRLLTTNDADTKKEKALGASAYDELFA